MTPALSALRHRNFRLLWYGQLVSFSGSMMQSAAVLWHVSLLVPAEKKALALGLVGLVRIVPVVVFSLVGRVVADALDRRRLMIATQTVMTAAAAILGFLTFRGLTAVWPIYLLSAVGAAAGAFDGPARQALIPDLVPREHLPNAISLNTIMFQIASVLGPSVGGICIATLGIGAVYVLNAGTFLAVIGALLAMRGVKEKPASERPRVSFASAVEGLRFVFSAPLIRSSMLLDFFATFFSSATALLPIFAQEILHVGAGGYGWLYAAPAAGAIVAGVAMVRLVDKIDRRGPVLFGAVFVYGAATVLFGVSRSFTVTFLALAVIGAADAVSTVFRNVIRQLVTPDELRGRMTSINMVFFMGGPQLGELEAGLVANWFGAPVSVAAGGLACLAVTGLLAWKTPVLRGYRREADKAPLERKAAG